MQCNQVNESISAEDVSHMKKPISRAKPGVKTNKRCPHGRERKSRCPDCGGSEICEHRRIRAICGPCGGKYRCEHNRLRTQCKQCKGSSLCEHNNLKWRCQLCGTGRCEHNKYRNDCLVCNGCEHGQRKDRCPDCGGKGLCVHGRRKGLCVDCGGPAFCIHRKQKIYCAECDGSSLCEHNNLKWRCQLCGTGRCEHNKYRSDCLICNGCEHGQRKDRCPNCGGKGLCVHGRRKGLCVDCGGPAFCIHRKQKIYCAECDGSSLCAHGKRRCVTCGKGNCEHGVGRSDCVICNGCEHGHRKDRCRDCGKGLCVHGIRKNQCADCGGSQMCEHRRQRTQCKECKGGSICGHNHRRSTCKLCHGGSLCVHNIDRHECKECLPSEKMAKSKKWCIGCFSKRISRQRQQAGIRLCAECDSTLPPRIEHVIMPKFIEAMGFEPSAKDDQMIGGQTCDANRRRPDACWISQNRIAFLEIDEHGHDDRLPSCEVAKVIDQTLSVQKAYPNSIVVHFRFNPHACGYRISMATRIQQTVHDMKLFLSAQDEYKWRSEIPYVLYYFYPQRAQFQIEYVLNKASDAIQVLQVKNDCFQQVHHLEPVSKKRKLHIDHDGSE